MCFRVNHSHNNKCRVLGDVISSDLRTDTHLKSESCSNDNAAQTLTFELFAPGTFSSFTWREADRDRKVKPAIRCSNLRHCSWCSSLSVLSIPLSDWRQKDSLLNSLIHTLKLIIMWAREVLLERSNTKRMQKICKQMQSYLVESNTFEGECKRLAKAMKYIFSSHVIVFPSQCPIKGSVRYWPNNHLC